MKSIPFAVFVALATIHAGPPVFSTPQESVAPVPDTFLATDDGAWKKILNSPVSIELSNSSLQEAFDGLLRGTNANATLTGALKKGVGISRKFTNVPLRNALHEIARQSGATITWRMRDGVPHGIHVSYPDLKNARPMDGVAIPGVGATALQVAPKALIFRAYDFDEKTGRVTAQFTQVGQRTVFVDQGALVPGTTLSVTRFDPKTENLTLTDIATKKEMVLSPKSFVKLPPESK